MEALLEQLRTYLAMDTEIPFDEFNEYYKKVITELNANFNEMTQDACLQAKYICSIIRSNADARAKRSKANAKTYKKIAGKCAFWEDAVNYRLTKEGMSTSAIEEAMAKLNEEEEEKN